LVASFFAINVSSFINVNNIACWDYFRYTFTYFLVIFFLSITITWWSNVKARVWSNMSYLMYPFRRLCLNLVMCWCPFSSPWQTRCFPWSLKWQLNNWKSTLTETLCSCPCYWNWSWLVV
jgi:hypothetical protein